MNLPRIVVVDPHDIVRVGIAHLLLQDGRFTVCGQAPSANRGLELVGQLRPDLVITEVHAGEKNAVEFLHDVRALSPRLPVLVFSGHDEMFYGSRLMHAGANGYLMKCAPEAQLVEAIGRVLKGDICISHRLNSVLVGSLAQRQKTVCSVHKLTGRERELFSLLGRGLPTETIAAQLNISVRTIDAHRTNIRKKLGLPDSVALLRYAVQWVEAGERLSSGGSSD